MEERITEGPSRGDLESYLACIDRLHDAVKFFHDRRAYRSAEPAWRHAYGLLDKGLSRCDETLRKVLDEYHRATTSAPQDGGGGGGGGGRVTTRIIPFSHKTRFSKTLVSLS